MLKVDLEKLAKEQAVEIEMLKKANEELAMEIAGWQVSHDWSEADPDGTITTTGGTTEVIYIKPRAVDRR